MVYITPVADCIPQLREFQAFSKGLGEKPLPVLPVSTFNITNVHMTPENAELYSAAVGDDILALIRYAQKSNRMPQ